MAGFRHIAWVGCAADGLGGFRHIAWVGFAADGLRCIGRGCLLDGCIFTWDSTDTCFLTMLRGIFCRGDRISHRGREATASRSCPPAEGSPGDRYMTEPGKDRRRAIGAARHHSGSRVMVAPQPRLGGIRAPRRTSPQAGMERGDRLCRRGYP